MLVVSGRGVAGARIREAQMSKPGPVDNIDDHRRDYLFLEEHKS
jgi:hypothetical protein